MMVDSWPMMSSPGPMLCIVGTYLAFVLKVGPKMMEKRPAFQLNNLLILYNALQVLFSIWLTLKVFFVLRKKQNQVTFLHVYHHTITSIFSWCYLKFLPGEQGALIGFLNTFVHIVMYSYYLIAALGPEYKKYLWWKKYMTWIQLVQFFVMLGYQLMILAMDCKVPKALTYFFITNTIIFIYLFGDFYQKAYKKKQI
ncbi:unnamed protein product, partial [Heterotrigona itama]